MTEPPILLAAARTALPFIPALVATCLRVLILLSVAFGALWVLRNASAKLRHIVWLSTVGGSLFLFALSLTGPLFHVTFRRGGSDTHAALSVLSSTLLPTAGALGFWRGMPPLAAQEWRRISMGREWLSLWPSFVLFVWILGAVSGWLRILWGRLQLMRMVRANQNAAGPYAQLARGLSLRVGIRRKVRVVESKGCVTPVTRGIVSPVILLPYTMRGWSFGARKSVLLHELRHIRRGDSLTLAIAFGICSLLWFVPPIWAAYSGLYLEQEKACDEAVIQSGIKRQAYAACIMDAAQLCREPSLLTGLSFSGRRKRVLKDRIKAIVREGKSLRESVALFSLASLLLGAAVALGAAGSDAGKRYGSLYLTEYKVRSAEEAGIVDALIQYEDAFNAHDLSKMLSLFAKGAVYMPCGGWYTKFHVESSYCQHIIERNFEIFKSEAFYDPRITLNGRTAVVGLLLESGFYLTDYTLVLKRGAHGWLVSDASYENERLKS